MLDVCFAKYWGDAGTHRLYSPEPPATHTPLAKEFTEDVFKDALLALDAVPTIGPYECLSLLGRGGMSSVFKARHVRLGNMVALKVLSRKLMKSPDAQLRFQREMRLVASLDHPHIVRALHADAWHGIHYLVMEYVEGWNLEQLIEQYGCMTVAGACRIVHNVALAVEHAHRQGIIHRDLKPHNILLTPDGTVKVLDLGLGRIRATDRVDNNLTHVGEWLGTPNYMAPEQWTDASSVDERADLYAVGCLLFYLLNGTPPFGTDNYATRGEKMLAHLRGAIPSLRHIRTDIPVELDQLYQTLLAKRPEHRLDSATALLTAIEPFLNEQAGVIQADAATRAVENTPDNQVPPLPKSEAESPAARRWRTAAFVAISVGCLLAVGVVAYLRRPRSADIKQNIVASPRSLNDAGKLDPLFGKDGFTLAAMAPGANSHGNAMTLQPDGKVLIAGHFDNAANGFDMSLLRFTADGHLDPSFGPNGDGKASYHFEHDDIVECVGLLSDCSIVTAGWSVNGLHTDFAVVKFDSSGQVVASRRMDLRGTNDVARAMVIDPHDRIVLAGSSRSLSDLDIAVVRLDSDLNLDPSFGSAGKVFTPVEPSNDEAYSIALIGEKILVAGYTIIGGNGGRGDIALVRYNSDGSIDLPFGSYGKVITPVGTSHDEAASVAIQADGKIVVAGYARGETTDDIALVRFQADGQVDTTFGSQGKVIMPVSAGDDAFQSLAIQRDGKLVAAGYAGNANNRDLALVRFNTDGTLDESFGSGGQVISALGPAVDFGKSAAITRQGQIIVAGTAHNGTNSCIALARYVGENASRLSQ